jgi:penicillin V acylase-like amidase (Ntn superfamily)
MSFITRTIRILSCSALIVTQAFACTRILWNDNGNAVMVGRNMDFNIPMPADLWAQPRGLERTGEINGSQLKWRSKYGSVVVVALGQGVTDGVNEAGLDFNALWLAPSDYGPRDINRTGLSAIAWGQFFLDNYATVAEALNDFPKRNIQIVAVPAEANGQKIVPALHLSIADKTGDSAILEYIAGKLIVHHGSQFRVMANAPPYDVQLSTMKQFTGFGGDKPLPGANESADRFVRASYYLKMLPKPTSTPEMMAELLSVMHNVAQPFGVSDPGSPANFPTRWSTIADLTHGVFYFAAVTSPYPVWVDLKKLDFSEHSPVRKLDLTNDRFRSGDSTSSFEPASPYWLSAGETVPSH